MPRTILLLRHMPADEGERVSARLRALGFDLLECCPATGDTLPACPADYAVVVYGGVQSANDGKRAVYLDEEVHWIRCWVEGGGRYLGLCLGAQLLARAFGATVAPHPQGLHEIGFTPVIPTGAGDDFMDAPLWCYQWHEEGFEIPAGGVRLAAGEGFPNQAFRLGGRAYGLQFHPEVTPAIIRSWNAYTGDVSGLPGAHSLGRQLADAERHGPAMGAWLDAFVTHWTRT